VSSGTNWKELLGVPGGSDGEFDDGRLRSASVAIGELR
jgi:hypothetical protein